MENEIKDIIKEFANPREETLDNAVKRICALFNVSNSLPDHVVKFRLEELEMKYDYLMEQFNKMNDC